MGRGNSSETSDFFFGDDLLSQDEESREFTARETVRADGTREWRLGGELHRDDGPAVIKENGDSEWWTHGRQGREDTTQPSVIYYSSGQDDLFDGESVADWHDAEGKIFLRVFFPFDKRYNRELMRDVFRKCDPELFTHIEALEKEVGAELDIGQAVWLDGEENTPAVRRKGPSVINTESLFWYDKKLKDFDSVDIADIKQGLEEELGKKY